jgi:hypothetical protein
MNPGSVVTKIYRGQLFGFRYLLHVPVQDALLELLQVQ